MFLEWIKYNVLTVKIKLSHNNEMNHLQSISVSDVYDYIMKFLSMYAC